MRPGVKVDLNNIDRRSFFKHSGAVVLGASVAGCTEEDPGSSADQSQPETTDNQTPTQTPEITETQTPTESPKPTEEPTPTEEFDSSEVEEEPGGDAEEEPNLDHLHGITGFTWPPDVGGHHSRRYEWSAVGYDWWYENKIRKALSDYYDERYSRSGEYDMYISDAYGRRYISGLADELERIGRESELSEAETFNLAIKFVQQMQYTRDDVTSPFDQYSNYPVETLIKQGGDCEDSAILLAAILSQMGYGCVLLDMPDTKPQPHMAMGVKGDPSIPGSYYEYNGDRYYYIEGTADYDVGEMPDWGGSTDANIIPVNKNYPTIVYGYQTFVTNSNEVAVSVEIANYGKGYAQNVSFNASFKDENELVYSEKSSNITNLGNEETTEEVLHLTPPEDKRLRLVTTVTINGNLHDFDRSEWQYPVT
jgi:hypothetical protein